jgi:two-component system chemotaxis response regulator CheY
MSVRVLVVDDSVYMRDIVCTRLEYFGCKIIAQASNGDHAVKLFKALKPDLVTLDVLMPALNGIDALSAFRLIKSENHKAHIMIVSAVPFEHTRESFVKEGALEYILKPFTKFSFEPARRKLERIFPELARYQSRLGA